MRSFPLLSLFCAVAVSQHHMIKWTPGQKVKTTSGVLAGRESQWLAGVSEYLGVPFAQPPVGEMRFAPPKAFIGNATIDATKFSPDCPANVEKHSVGNNATRNDEVDRLLGQHGVGMGEDCLTLNIWARPQSGNPGKAVMIWVYGGGFAGGNTASPIYNGARLAMDEDVIVVSINYRVNVFGFPGAPFLADNNLGLQDIRLAVEWVRDNIKYFGGNPTRITLFGQSAGGAAVDFYSHANVANPIAAGFITQSGSVGVGNHEIPHPTGSSWYNVTEKVGCGGAQDGEKTLSCLRSKDWKEVLKAVEGAGHLGMPSDVYFGPWVDDKLVFGDYDQRRKDGKFAKVPMLTGSNDNEGGVFDTLAEVGMASGKNVAVGMGMHTGMDANKYDNMFTCPAEVAAQSHREQGLPAWRYRYAGEWQNLYIGAKGGAYHGAELAMIFGTTELISSYPNTAEQTRLGNAMRDAWGAFAKDPANGLSNIGWPVYDETKPTLIKLGGKDNGNITFVGAREYDGNCGKVTAAMLAHMLVQSP